MRPVPIPLIAVTIVSVSLSCAQSPQWKFQLSSSAGSVADGDSVKIEMQAAETTVVRLRVVGPVSEPVTFSAAGPPAFGSLQGPVLRLSPGRQDAGEYTVTVTASAGGDSQTASLHLVVHGYNSAPEWNGTLSFYDNHGFRTMYCPGPLCTADGTPKLEFWVCEEEGDGIIIDVEVVRRGQQFTKVPTHSSSVPSNPHPPNCGAVQVALAGLTLEQSYDFAVRISDEFRAVAKKAGAPDGRNYDQYWGFDQGACTTRKCACISSGVAFLH